MNIKTPTFRTVRILRYGKTSRLRLVQSSKKKKKKQFNPKNGNTNILFNYYMRSK